METIALLVSLNFIILLILNKYVTLFHITFFWGELMLILLPVIVSVRFLHMF